MDPTSSSIIGIGNQPLASEEPELELVDRILADYYPYKWVSPYLLRGSDTSSDDGDDERSQAQNVEKWLLVGFCSVCVLAMVVCIVVLIIYKVRKGRRNREDSIERLHRQSAVSSNSRQRQPRQGSHSSQQRSRSRDKAPQRGQEGYHYMIPPLSTVSERSENLEYSLMGSALSRSNKSQTVSMQRNMRNRGSENNPMKTTLLSTELTADAKLGGNFTDSQTSMVEAGQQYGGHGHTMSETMTPAYSMIQPQETTSLLAGKKSESGHRTPNPIMMDQFSMSTTQYDPSMQNKDESSLPGSIVDGAVSMTIEPQQMHDGRRVSQ